MKKPAAFLIFLVVLAFFAFLWVQKNGKPCVCYGVDSQGICVGIKTPCNSVVVEEKATDTFTFNAVSYRVGDTFNLKPSQECVADIRVKATKASNTTLQLEVLEEQGVNRNYHEVEAGRTLQIKDGSCYAAFPLCMDVRHDYCFKLDSGANPPAYSYELKARSTMPSPSSK